MPLVVTMAMDANQGETEDREIARFEDYGGPALGVGTVLEIDDHLCKVVGLYIVPADGTLVVKVPRNQAWIDELETDKPTSAETAA